MTLDLNPQFQYALQLMQEGEKHLFITGKAGTGKSTLLEHFCTHADKATAVVAPTGVAALNVRGQTIHRFFNFYLDVTPEKIRNLDTRPKDPRIYQKLKSIIIDEVSMLRADLLDCIDVFLRLYGPDETKAFGGIQMIFVGDLYQLPPVVTSQEKSVFSTCYATPYFFSAHVFNDLAIEIIELETVYRQKDQDFIHLLNRIRNNSVTDQDIDLLNSRYLPIFTPQNDEFYINLTTTNHKADQINDEHLQMLKGKLYHAEAEIEGKFSQDYFPTAPQLQYKIGAQVMLLNNDVKKRWVNGSIGMIETIKHEDGEDIIGVRLQDNQRKVNVTRFTWEVFQYAVDRKTQSLTSKSVGTFTQFPFRLAWAVTIHKSQGKTFDRVLVDMDRGAFATGQLYVALSRCTSFEGIVLRTPITPRHIRTDPRIYNFLTGYHYQKAALELSLSDKISFIQQAIDTKIQLDITYLKANDTKSQRTIIPITVGPATYQGKEFPGLHAFCTEHQEERMFHVGRILKMKAV